MSLIVEDGSGLSNSESYVSVADADTRQSNLGNDTWATLTTAKRLRSVLSARVYGG